MFGRVPTSMLLLTLCAPLALPLPRQEERSPQTLERGEAVTNELLEAQVHAYLAELAAGRAYLIEVEQLGVDVLLELSDPAGRTVMAVDSPLGSDSIESVLVKPDVSGSFRVQVRGSPKHGDEHGRYTMRFDELAAETPEERQRIVAEEVMSAAGELYANGSGENRRAAVEKYEQALSHWRALGHRRREATALACLAGLFASLSEPRQAIDYHGQALPVWESLGERGRQASTLTGLGFNLWVVGENERAREVLNRALAIRRDQKDISEEASVRNNICLTFHSEGALRRALACYERALELFRHAQQALPESTVLSNMGSVYRALGEPDQAEKYHLEALEIREREGDQNRQAHSLNNLATVYRDAGKMQEALTYFSEALSIHRAREDRRWEATTLHNIGTTYYLLGMPERAVSFFNQALPLQRDMEDRRGQNRTLNDLGRANSLLGDLAAARRFHEEALAVAREGGYRRGEARALQLLGQSYAASGEYEESIEYLTQGQELATAMEDRRTEAETLREIGNAYCGMGRRQSALKPLNRALESQRTIGDRVGEVQTLQVLAETERSLGRAKEARAYVDAAIDVIEALRTTIQTPDLRASFGGSRRRAYELRIDLIMARHLAEPKGQHEQTALAASEQARARTLLELLGEGGDRSRYGLDPDLASRRRALQRRLNAKADRQLELLNGEHRAEDVAQTEAELATILSEIDNLEAEMRRASPRYAALKEKRALEVGQIQQLLDEETVLLEYALGEERSFLWAVTHDAVTSFVLPSRSEIESLTRVVHDELSKIDFGAPAVEHDEFLTLSKVLLDPVSELLDGALPAEGRRIVVVPDGALHYIPFGALPDPNADFSAPLLARHEVSYLPSASTLDALRGLQTRRGRASRAIAVIADPVFDERDSRARRATVPPSSSDGLAEPMLRSGGQSDPMRFHRLPDTRREAEAIASLAPESDVLKALDFRASRSTVLSDELSQFRIVHFATHGLLDARNPQLSGLVLSLVDENGKAQDGFLRMHDIYDIHLSAELVVLSGCQTALGKEIRGEGLVGLARGFMYAGAPRVVASLWRVEDLATAELMKRFYRAMIVDREPAAKALRAAQLSIAQERRWKDPFYWAAFVLQGDWR